MKANGEQAQEISAQISEKMETDSYVKASDLKTDQEFLNMRLERMGRQCDEIDEMLDYKKSGLDFDFLYTYLDSLTNLELASFLSIGYFFIITLRTELV